MARTWNPAAHPRDSRGRFTRSGTKLLTDADRAAGRAAMAGFKPKRMDNPQAMAYLKANKPKLKSEQVGAVDRYTGDGFFDLNKRLRAGETSDPEIGRLDAAMQPLPDDLLLTRHVQLDAFGKVPIDQLAGTKVRDAAYASTALGTPYGGGLGGVTMHIAAPAGTPAVLAAALSRNPTEREVLLDRDLEMAVSRVVPNQRGGYDMYLVVLPKTSTGG